LRWAIDGANKTWRLFNEASTITIPSSIYVAGENALTGVPFSTIQLNGTQLPTITSQLTIVGDQTLHGFFAPVWYISGAEQSRVFQVGATGSLTLENLTIENGSTTHNGGGILNQGSLTLENVTLSANRASSGGGIDNTGSSMLIEHSIITGNTASVSGGGVRTSGANVTFNHDQITNNGVWGVDHSMDSASSSPSPGGQAKGGGLDIAGGTVSISLSTISGNTAQGGQGAPGSNGTSYDPSPTAESLIPTTGKAGGTGITGGSGGQANGGGIMIDQALSVTIINSTLSNNTVRGGILR
jgi:hypothetical protein